MSERTKAAAMSSTPAISHSMRDTARNRRSSVEVLIGRLLWGALFAVVMWVGAS